MMRWKVIWFSLHTSSMRRATSFSCAYLRGEVEEEVVVVVEEEVVVVVEVV